ncbi:hypothetical protein CAPTEDRAFT_127392, partial [Capitella teleta]
VFSKIFERLLDKRLFDFLNLNKTFTPSQYGFRKAFSAEMALADTVNRRTSELDKASYIFGLFLDLKNRLTL